MEVLYGAIVYNRFHNKKSQAFKRHLDSTSENQIKHLILTGKSGSGKTSVVEALARYLNEILIGEGENAFRNCQKELDIKFNKKMDSIPELAEKHHYILAYYEASRVFQAEQPKQMKSKHGLLSWNSF